MLTNNGKALIMINNTDVRYSSSTFLKIRDTANTKYQKNLNEAPPIAGALALYAGTGTAEPRATDLNMTNRNAGLTALNRTNTVTGTIPDAHQDYIAIFTVTYRNDTNADVTVTEVGLMSDVSRNQFLFARELLPTPVTLAPGDVYTFTMYIG